MVLSLIGALAVHYIFGGVRLQGVGDRMTTAARAHLTTLVAVFVLLKAVAYFLDRRALLLETTCRTGLYGAGYTDVNALLPAKEILAYISIVVAIAIIVFSNAVMRNLVWPGVSLALLAHLRGRDRRHLPAGGAELQVKPSLRGQGSAVHPAQHRRHPGRVRAGDTEVQTPYAASNLAPPATPGHRHLDACQNVRLLDPQLVVRDVHPAPAGPRLLRLRPEARHRPVHGRRQDRRTTWSASARSTTAS